MIQETPPLLNSNTKINTAKEYSSETLRKIKSGILILCDCGGTHSGKYLKCSKCLSKPCSNCGTPFIKGGRDVCRKCLVKRSNSTSL